MKVKAKKRVVQYLMLLTGILVLLSVVMPHHHHSNGMPCYLVLAAEAQADNSHAASEGHDCDCSGHNPVFTSSFELHATDGDVGQYLYPLLVLFDYMYPPEIAFHRLFFERERSVYIESLHDTWIARAAGLRAPPQLV